MARVESLLGCAAAARPLYAPTWVDRAEAAMRRGDVARADTLLGLASALWPARPRLLWRTALLRAERGNGAESLRLLRAYLDATDVSQMDEPLLRVAAQAEPDASRRLHELLPQDDPDRRAEEIRRILHVALQSGDLPLAEPAWLEVPDDVRSGGEILDLYVEALLRQGETGRAIAAWRRHRSVATEPDAVTDGGFEEDPGQRGFRWRVRQAPGAVWARDAAVRHEGRHSLRIAFDGESDAGFQHVSQLVPLTPGAYRLQGFWRGRDLRPGAGPYVEAAARGAPSRVSLPPRAGTWDWEPFAIEFRVQPGVAFVEVRLRRDAVASGLGLRGELWLDDVDVQRIPESRADG